MSAIPFCQRLLNQRHRETQGAGEGEGRLQGGGRVARMREEEVGAGEGEKMNYNQYLYMVDHFWIKHDIISTYKMNMDFLSQCDLLCFSGINLHFKITFQQKNTFVIFRVFLYRTLDTHGFYPSLRLVSIMKQILLPDTFAILKKLNLSNSHHKYVLRYMLTGIHASNSNSNNW